MADLKLLVQGMSCGGCATSVKRALLAVPGVAEVQVELSSGVVEVVGEGLDPDALSAAVERLGFSARSAL